jgi:uncharacterized RDD family membrane protein YckC
MKKITVVTPANIELEYRLGGVGSRLAAFIIDFAIQVSLIGLAAGVILLGFDRWVFGNTTPTGMAMGAVLITFFIIHSGYFILCEWVMNGQSIGKKIFGLRVIRENGLPLSIGNILVRGLFRASVDMMYVGLFVILFSKQHKRLGDMAAGTVVVSEHYVKTPGLYETPAAVGDTPMFFSEYTPEEQRIVEEWLRRKEALPDGGLDIKKRLDAYFNYKKTLNTMGSDSSSLFY